MPYRALLRLQAFDYDWVPALGNSRSIISPYYNINFDGARSIEYKRPTRNYSKKRIGQSRVIDEVGTYHEKKVAEKTHKPRSSVGHRRRRRGRSTFKIYWQREGRQLRGVFGFWGNS